MKKRIMVMVCVLILCFSCVGQVFAAEYIFTDQDILADLQFCDYVGYTDPFSVFGVSATRQKYADYLALQGVDPYVRDVVTEIVVPEEEPSVADPVLTEIQTELPATVVTYNIMTYTEQSGEVFGLKAALYSIFGEYTPNTYTQVIVNADGTTESYEVVPAGLAGVDWEWVGGVFLFSVMLYCLLRLLGGVLK